MACGYSNISVIKYLIKCIEMDGTCCKHCYSEYVYNSECCGSCLLISCKSNIDVNVIKHLIEIAKFDTRYREKYSENDCLMVACSLI